MEKEKLASMFTLVHPKASLTSIPDRIILLQKAKQRQHKHQYNTLLYIHTHVCVCVHVHMWISESSNYHFHWTFCTHWKKKEWEIQPVRSPNSNMDSEILSLSLSLSFFLTSAYTRQNSNWHTNWMNEHFPIVSQSEGAGFLSDLANRMDLRVLCPRIRVFQAVTKQWVFNKYPCFHISTIRACPLI